MNCRFCTDDMSIFICEINPIDPIPCVKNISLCSAGLYDVAGTADE